MNNRYLAALGAALLLALPLSAQAEATAAEAAWTPPVVTAEEMDAAHLGEAGGRRRAAVAAAAFRFGLSGRCG